ncbi:MAG TPA: hypothetical protein VLT87_28880, partial [Thermoanaerobaculia bacterium]|nr:hypothetical protein [Thermoanaerobaculia bacterium]
FRRIEGGPDAERVAIAGALLFHLGPAMMVQGALPMSDPPALMFLSLALAAGAYLMSIPRPGPHLPGPPLPPPHTPSLGEEGAETTNPVFLPSPREGARGGGRGAGGEGLGGGPWALSLGAFASAAIGCRPQLALAVLPFLAVALAQIRGWRPRLLALGAFTAVSLVWLLPLVAATGGVDGFLDYQLKQAGYVAAHDAESSRNGWSAAAIAFRFIAHPWGPKWMSFPVLALAAWGTASLVRRRRWAALPLVTLTAVHIAVGLLVMDPADGVRYALPSVLGVAFLAAVGAADVARLFRVPRLAYAAVALVAVGAVVYAGPLLEVRSTSPSPPAQAAAWAKGNLPQGTVVLWEGDLVPHSAWLLRGFETLPVDVGMERFARASSAPVWLFAEGEIAGPGAQVFRWPDSDAYGKLTRNKYRVVSLAPLPRSRRYLPLRGLQPFEQTVRETHWRWMDDDAALRVFPKGARELAVTLALPPEAPVPASSVAILVAGRPAGFVEVPRGEKRRVVLPLPAAPSVDVVFRTGRIFVPALAGTGTDTRRLAVQLFDVEQIP